MIDLVASETEKSFQKMLAGGRFNSGLELFLYTFQKLIIFYVNGNIINFFRTVTSDSQLCVRLYKSC